jgi:phosphoglycerol transferase MdoB-like AlkP superfamily enzyme
LRADLKVWTITRQLAIRSDTALAAEISSPVSLATLLAWLALLVGHWLGYSVHISSFFLAPLLVLCITLATSYDILRRSQSSDLMAGYVTAPGAGGLIISFILGAIPLMTVAWLASHWSAPGADLIITLFGLMIGAGLAFATWKLAAERYMTIK